MSPDDKSQKSSPEVCETPSPDTRSALIKLDWVVSQKLASRLLRLSDSAAPNHLKLLQQAEILESFAGPSLC